MTNQAQLILIGRKFENSVDDWQFVYNDAEHTLSLKVNLEDKSLVCDINKSDVDDLIEWLSQVQKSMEG